jgi:hypothetical protein
MIHRRHLAKPVMIIGFLLALATGSQARLGETPAQCQERYGPPTRIDQAKGLILYQKGGFLIAAKFAAGQCEAIAFSKIATTALGSPQPITAAEIATLLTANSQDHTWQPAAHGLTWHRQDGQAHATYSTQDALLTIATTTATQRKPHALEGF